LSRALEHFRAALAELRSIDGSGPASAGFVLPAPSAPKRGANRVDASGTREAFRHTYARRPRPADGWA
jgi:hypothetical protein